MSGFGGSCSGRSKQLDALATTLNEKAFGDFGAPEPGRDDTPVGGTFDAISVSGVDAIGPGSIALGRVDSEADLNTGIFGGEETAPSGSYVLPATSAVAAANVSLEDVMTEDDGGDDFTESPFVGFF